MAEMRQKRQFLGVFWDIQNVNIPKGMLPQAICKKIRDLNFCKGKKMCFNLIYLIINLKLYTCSVFGR